MSNEPKWLIGGPESTEQVTQPQQDVQIPADDDPVTQGRYQGKTAAQWREMATNNRRASQDSFDRCDTDGALSQWGLDVLARKYELCAKLAEQNGTWEFPALFTLTGGLVAEAVWIKTKLNKWVWRIGSGNTVAWFDPSKARSGARRRANDAAKGYQLGLVRTRAYVGTSGGGRGVSGALSVGYFIGRDDESPVEIIDNGSLGTQYKDDY